jgi:hypothetical protein
LLLPIAQIAYNNKLLEATGVTLFFTNYRRHLNLFTKLLDSNIQTELAIALVKALKEIYKKSLKNITKA